MLSTALAVLASVPARGVLRRSAVRMMAAASRNDNHVGSTAAPPSGFSRLGGVSTAVRTSGKPTRSLTFDEATPEDWATIVDSLGPFSRNARLEKLHEVLSKRRGGVHLVLENVADPYNVAAILRTAEGLGVQHIHAVETITQFHAAERPSDAPIATYGGKRSQGNVAMGASRWLTLNRYTSSQACYEALCARGLQVLASDCPPADAEDTGGPGDGEVTKAAQRSTPFVAKPVGDALEEAAAAEGSRGVALVFGNERRGVSKAFLEHADAAFFIPMVGLTQSFNISVAVAMSLYAVLASGKFPEGTLSEAERTELLGRWLVRDVKAAKQLLLREAKMDFVDF